MAVVDPYGHPGEAMDWQEQEDYRRLGLIQNARAAIIFNHDLLPLPQTMDQIIALRRCE
jgi:hypothetical protein